VRASLSGGRRSGHFPAYCSLPLPRPSMALRPPISLLSCSARPLAWPPSPLAVAPISPAPPTLRLLSFCQPAELSRRDSSPSSLVLHPASLLRLSLSLLLCPWLAFLPVAPARGVPLPSERSGSSPSHSPGCKLPARALCSSSPELPARRLLLFLPCAEPQPARRAPGSGPCSDLALGFRPGPLLAPVPRAPARI
jgi:hypothetical protein